MLLTAREKKNPLRFSFARRWRTTAFTHHLVAGEGNGPHPGFLHFSTQDSSTPSAPTVWAWSAKCLVPLSLQCHLKPNLETQAWAGLYRTVPSPANRIHGCGSGGRGGEGGGLSGVIHREAERRKHSRQRLNFYLNSRYLKKKRGCQIKTGLPLPQSGALNSIKGRRRGLVSVRAPRDAANASVILPFLLQRTVSRVPRRQWVEHSIFFGTNSTAVHLLIEPGSQREAQYRTLFLFLHLSY